MSVPASVVRARLRSKPANGHAAYLPPIRKLVFEFCNSWPTSHHTRNFLLNSLQAVARANPHVEVVVKERIHREPVVRGLYVNGRDKVISLKELEPSGIRQKVELLLNSSGAKIKPLKSRPVESTTESVRGIWSGLHAPRPTL